MNSAKLYLSILVIGALGVFACTQQTDKAIDTSNPIEVKMVDYAFAVTDSIPSGWNTFKMINKGEETHEFVLQRIPDDKTFDDVYSQVIQPMDSLQQLLLNGKIDSTEHQKALPKTLPKWVRKVEPAGGGGLITPDQTSNVTMNLQPGRYVMSCFISSENGRRHVFQGMVRPIIVNDSNTKSSAPDADVTIVSSGKEIIKNGQSLGFGTQTIAFHVEKPPADSINPYTRMYLAQLTDPTDRKEDLRNFDAYSPPVPLVGGVIAIMPGDTAYVTVDLTTPGPYSFVLTNMQDKKFKEFVVR